MPNWNLRLAKEVLVHVLTHVRITDDLLLYKIHKSSPDMNAANIIFMQYRASDLVGE
jgi:hypothetical protein